MEEKSDNLGCFKVFIFIIIAMVVFIFIDALDGYFKANKGVLWVASTLIFVGVIWHHNIKDKTNKKEYKDIEEENVRQEVQPIANASLIQEEIITLEEFIGGDYKKLSQLTVDIDRGVQVLKIANVTVANIEDKLRGKTVQETIENLAIINLNFIIYTDKTKLPCAIESKGQWEEVALF